MKQERILMSGASGLVGTALSKSLANSGHEVWKLVRRVTGPENEFQWDALSSANSIDAERLEGFDAVVHLAGEPVFGRWTEEKKHLIRESRVLGTHNLSIALAGCKHPPQVIVCASAIGFYGNRGDEILTENSAPGQGFLADVVRDWEAAAEPARNAGVRTVHLRIGIVLSRDGGALRQMLPAFRLGLGGRIGKGDQWMSWITLDDLVRVIGFVMENEKISGPVNAVAPGSATNLQFTQALADTLQRPAILPVPISILRTLFGEFADEAMTVSERVVPARLLEEGFQFENGNLTQALCSVLQDRPSII